MFRYILFREYYSYYLTGFFAGNMPDQQQASVDVAGPSGFDTSKCTLDKPQPGSISDTISIELSQSAEDKHDVTEGPMHENATLPSSGTKGDLNFEVNASISQNINLSKVIVFYF